MTKALTPRQTELDATIAANPDAIAFAGVYVYTDAEGEPYETTEDVLVCSDCATSYVHAQDDDELLPDKLQPYTEDALNVALREEVSVANEGVCNECEEQLFDDRTERTIWRRDNPFVAWPGDEPEHTGEEGL